MGCLSACTWAPVLTLHFSLQIIHISGIPYNPTGQAVVERKNKTLNLFLQKQKGGTLGRSPREQLAQAICTINNLTLDYDSLTPSQKFFSFFGHNDIRIISEKQITPQQQQVLWKDVTEVWRGPDRVLTRGRGFLSVSTHG